MIKINLVYLDIWESAHCFRLPYARLPKIPVNFCCMEFKLLYQYIEYHYHIDLCSLQFWYKIDLLRTSIEEFCCCCKIEIKYLFSWLLQNNLLGVEMLHELQKPRLTPRLFYFKQHFSTSEVILQQT